MKLTEKLSKIQFEFKAKKSRFNSFGKYNFRSAEDILEALKPMNDKYNVHFTIKENLTIGNEFPIIHSTASIIDNESGDEIIATAIVGVDLNAKGQQMPQRFGSASSYGKKYALGNLLLIDDTADADATNTHGKDTQRQTLEAQVNALEKKVMSNKKPVIDMNNIDQAKKFLSNGGLMKTLEEKYTITKEALVELNG
tara:strand:- start:512 stop:1102 length:591 start_codon:yes stop_codon:yes gene_type:complete